MVTVRYFYNHYTNIFHKKKSLSIALRLMFLYYNLSLMKNLVTWTKGMGNLVRTLNLSRSPLDQGRINHKTKNKNKNQCANKAGENLCPVSGDFRPSVFWFVLFSATIEDGGLMAG